MEVRYRGVPGLRRIKMLFVFAVLFILASAGISVEGIEGKREGIIETRPGSELDQAVRGAVEDQQWMSCRTEEEVRISLGRHFEGALLEDLTRRTWSFIARPTDWYSQTRLLDMRVLYNDGNRAVVEALIGIEDIDSGHNESGKGLFAMSRSPDGWKVNYMAFSWP